MNNVTMLEEELKEYTRLENEKKALDISLRNLSGQNDEESIRRINEISKRLGEINNFLSQYDSDILKNMQNYLDLRNKFNQIAENIKKIEELSKEGKRPNKGAEFITLSSAEGRNKNIDKRLASEYMKLVEEKKKIKIELDKAYNLIKGKMSMKKDLPIKVEEMTKEVEYVLPKIKDYDDLNTEEKIKMTKERLERIFASSKLPNMGKKVVITHNGEKYEIPEKYKGLLKATLMELSKLEKKKEEPKVEEKKTVEPKVAIISKEESNTREKEMYEALGVPFDIERQKRIDELVHALFEEKAVSEKVNFRKKVTQKVNIAKSFVSTTSKKVSSKLKEKFKSTKEEEKKEEVSYQIINRTTNFKKDVCLRVNEKKSKLTEVNKSILSKIRMPFDKLRETKQNYVSKKDLIARIDELEREVNTLKNNKAKTRVLTNPELSRVGGFVSTAAFVITVSILITLVIFITVGLIVF